MYNVHYHSEFLVSYIIPYEQTTGDGGQAKLPEMMRGTKQEPHPHQGDTRAGDDNCVLYSQVQPGALSMSISVNLYW